MATIYAPPWVVHDLDAMMANLMAHGEVDLRTAFDVVIARSDVERSKPAPDVVAVACDRLRLPPLSCLMVGDTESDVQAAARAGVPAVGVLTSGLAPRTELKSRLRTAGAVLPWSGLDAMATALSAYGATAAAVVLEGDQPSR